MERLTLTAKPLPPHTFNFCQICGYTSGDICEFEMLVECDDNDQREPHSILIRCRSVSCMKVIADHPRLYITIAWSSGVAGTFILTCGDCIFRNGGTCTNPDLKANGGNGLEVAYSGLPMYNAHICFSDGRSFNGPSLTKPVVSCKGYRLAVV